MYPGGARSQAAQIHIILLQCKKMFFQNALIIWPILECSQNLIWLLRNSVAYSVLLLCLYSFTRKLKIHETFEYQVPSKCDTSIINTSQKSLDYGKMIAW